MPYSADTKIKKFKKQRIFFIERTDFLIREIGIENLTIRKIAQETGYNSATIYNFFDNLDHLILFASLKVLKAYTQALSKIVNDSMNSYEKYIKICDNFDKFTFNSPDIFWNIFFGKYSNNLDEVIKEYYDLFSDEVGNHSQTVLDMLFSGNIFARDRVLVNQLAEDGFIAESDLESFLQISVRLQQSFLYEIYLYKGIIDPEEHRKKHMALLVQLLKSFSIDHNSAI